MAKYAQYIEISPNYESVVDLSSEQRHPDMWMSYIVHEDMAQAIDKIIQSLKNENRDARRSFWIHGSYGTGKSYAAIVLKHLFEDDESKIRKFMGAQRLLPYREKFCALRRKGEYLVVWKSGCSEIHTGVQLIMEAEVAIRQQLKEKFGEKAYLGKRSTLDAVKERLQDESINWENVFQDPMYGLAEDYATLADLQEKIQNNDTVAANRVAGVILQKGWGLFSTTDTFKAWVKDVIEGNHLQDTGILFIWDEFTDYLRNNSGDTNVLQDLSEYCKQQPFFMCLIVHKDASWVDTLGEGAYNRIVHRYHELSFHITESATYDLIAGSIRVRAGMEQQWNTVCDELMRSIAKQRGAFVDDDLGSAKDRKRELCPIHPMTVSLLSKVAENFGASQRTLFRFMKDPDDKDHQVGFLYYIEQYGPEDWRWLTPDFLWDYFFMRASDIKEFSAEAQRCYQLFEDRQDFVNKNQAYLRVFKTCLLLIALMGQRTVTHLTGPASGTNSKLLPTRNTVIHCFAGILSEEEVRQALEAIADSKLLRFDEQHNGDARLELPFNGSTDQVEAKQQEIAKKYTRHILFSKDGFCANALKEKMWAKDNVYAKRIHVAVTSPEKTTLNTRLQEVQDILEKRPYMVGMLVVAPAEASQFVSLQDQLRTIAQQDTTERLVVVLVKTPFTQEQLSKWHLLTAKRELANNEGQRANAGNYENEANLILTTWAANAANDGMLAFYREVCFSSLFNVGQLMNKVTKEVFEKVYPYGTERFIVLNTAYRGATSSAAVTGLQREAGNTQMNTLLASVKRFQNLWDAETVNDLCDCSGSVTEDSVAGLAKFLSQRLAQGTQVDLGELWENLQSAPFGYADTMASAFVLGYVLRFYLDRDYVLVDSTGNTHPLTMQTTAEMIAKLCKGKLFNDKISSGTQTWRKFEGYIKNFFNLKPQESANENQARKNARGKIVDAGVPFWVLKYASEEQLGGTQAKQIACYVVDNMQAFLDEPSSAETSMANIVNALAGNGRVRKALCDIYNDHSACIQVLRAYLQQKDPELVQSVTQLGLNDSDLLLHLRQTLKGDTASWTEEDVAEHLGTLGKIYALLLAVNAMTGKRYQAIDTCQRDLKNVFQNMKVPGSVIETMDYLWLDAMKGLYHFSWRTGLLEELITQEELAAVVQHGKDAWQHISAPKVLLQDYLKSIQAVCSEEEIAVIFHNLHSYQYDTQVVTFKDAVESQLSKILYSRLKAEADAIWKEKTGTETVSAWCKEKCMPIAWMFDEDGQEAMQTLYYVQHNRNVMVDRMEGCRNYVKEQDLSCLQDDSQIMDRFLAQVGEEYRDLFMEDRNLVFAQIRSAVGPDVYAWATKTGQIIRALKQRQQEVAKERDYATAMENTKKMPEASLRQRIETMLAEQPELSRYFI